MRNLLVALVVLLAASCKGGYSFTGGDVGNAKTLSVTAFGNTSDLVNPMLAQRFTTELDQNAFKFNFLHRFMIHISRLPVPATRQLTALDTSAEFIAKSSD